MGECVVPMRREAGTVSVRGLTAEVEVSEKSIWAYLELEEVLVKPDHQNHQMWWVEGIELPQES